MNLTRFHLAHRLQKLRGQVTPGFTGCQFSFGKGLILRGDGPNFNLGYGS